MRALLIAVLVFSGCAGVLGPPKTPEKVDWPDVLQCGPDIPNLVSTISTLLLGAEKPGQEATQLAIGPSKKRELEDLALKNGASTVACLVDLLQRQWTRPGASQTPERFAAARRAQSFLASVGTKVESNEAYAP